MNYKSHLIASYVTVAESNVSCVTADRSQCVKVSRIWLTNHPQLLGDALTYPTPRRRGTFIAFIARSSHLPLAIPRVIDSARSRAGASVPLINMPYNREPACRPAKGKAHAERYTGTGGERLISHRMKKGEAESRRDDCRRLAERSRQEFNKVPTQNGAISRHAIDGSHVRSHYSQWMHNKCIANTRPAVCPQTRFDLVGKRAHACTRDVSETQRPENSRGASRPKQNIRSIIIVNHQDSRYSLNGHFAVHRMQAGAPLPIRVAKAERFSTSTLRRRREKRENSKALALTFASMISTLLPWHTSRVSGMWKRKIWKYASSIKKIELDFEKLFCGNYVISSRI